MALIRYQLPLIICTVVSVSSLAKEPAKSLSKVDPTQVDPEQQQSQQGCVPVTEWFDQYDQIRRDAEMTMVDRLQSMLLAAKKPEKKNAWLASRMIKKYTTALSEMRELESTPQTKELQQSYIEYYSTARQLFADYLDEQKQVPFTNQSLMPAKKKLEELVKKNKKLDDELRRKFIISKHKHS